VKEHYVPIVAIIGRPNVGKSTIFNRIIGSRRAIVGDESGITRDRLYDEVLWNEKTFRLVDTGGMIPNEKDLIPLEILRQASMAIAEADAILFVVDAQCGVHSLDEEINRLILKTEKKFFLVANKVDDPKHESGAFAFFQLGVPKVYPVSAEHNRGLEELLDHLTEDFTPVEKATPSDEIGVAVIGRPNVGKSMLVNALVGAERVIVSEIPGTTRDSVDTRINVDGKTYRLIDTAGIRRKGKTKLKTEKISVIMARRSLARADIALLLLDPVEGVTHLDAAIAGYALESGSAVILCINKLDLMPKGEEPRYTLIDQIKTKCKFLDFAPVIFFSAKTRRNLQKIFPLLETAYAHRYMRISTGKLNQFYQDIMAGRGFESMAQSNLGVKYLTQIKTAPPTFLLFIKKRHELHFSEKRFIINQIRKEFEFFANPIVLREKSRL